LSDRSRHVRAAAITKCMSWNLFLESLSNGVSPYVLTKKMSQLMFEDSREVREAMLDIVLQFYSLNIQISSENAVNAVTLLAGRCIVLYVGDEDLVISLKAVEAIKDQISSCCLDSILSEVHLYSF
jgi:hypothetical protein